MSTYVGIDLAWGYRARTGVAVVDEADALVASGVVVADDEIDAWLTEHAPAPSVVGVDAPLIVPNATGMRDCERMVGASFGRFEASCHASNRSMPAFDPPRAETLAARHGWSVDPAGAAPVCLEVYPHAAMVGLFGLRRTLKYKRGPVVTRRAAFLDLVAHLESVSSLALDGNARWNEIRGVVAAATRPVDLDRVEDEVDAIVCAHVAWLWAHRRDTLRVYGDTAGGLIVAPPPPRS